MWIEVNNDNEEFLVSQYRSNALCSPDYVGVSDDEAVSSA